DLLQVAAQERQLGAFLVVAHVHVRFKRGLVAKQFVVVSLVRPDGDVERRIQIHPVNITLVVIIGKKRLGARSEKFLERSILGQRRCFLQQRGGTRKIVVDGRAIVSLAVGNGRQRAI